MPRIETDPHECHCRAIRHTEKESYARYEQAAVDGLPRHAVRATLSGRFSLSR
jgi:hypothetical protein